MQHAQLNIALIPGYLTYAQRERSLQHAGHAECSQTQIFTVATRGTACKAQEQHPLPSLRNLAVFGLQMLSQFGFECSLKG